MEAAGSLFTLRNPTLYECWLIRHFLGSHRSYILISKLCAFAILFPLYSIPSPSLSLRHYSAYCKVIFLHKVAPNLFSQMDLSHSDHSILPLHEPFFSFKCKKDCRDHAFPFIGLYVITQQESDPTKPFVSQVIDTQCLECYSNLYFEWTNKCSKTLMGVNEIITLF